MTKSSRSNLLIVIAVLLIVAYGYLLYKVWSVFGFWTILVTTIAQLYVSSRLQRLANLRSESGGVVTFNPKEWPKFLSLVFSALIGYYLFTVLQSPGVSASDWNFGVGYLVLLTVVPMSYTLYKLLRDRNDFVSVSGDVIEYRDNDDRGKVAISQVVKSELSGIDLQLTLSDGATTTIRLSNMNFTLADAGLVCAEIEGRLPKSAADATPASA